MTSTLVDEYPSLFYQLLFFPVYVSVIVIKYLTLIRIIVVYFFGLLERVFPRWDPALDPHTASIRRMLHRRPNHLPRDYCWNCYQNVTIVSGPACASILSDSAIFNTNLLTSFQSIIIPNLLCLSSFQLFEFPLECNDGVTDG